MADPAYLWLAPVGFYFTLGVTVACVITLVLLRTLCVVVDGFIKLVKRKSHSVEQYTFKYLPDHLSNMYLAYDKKSKTVTASCQFTKDNIINTRWFTVDVPNKECLEACAHNAQLSVMTHIAKENTYVSKQRSKS